MKKKLAEHVGMTEQGVAQWFYQNKRSLKNLDDVADFILYQRIKKHKNEL